MQSPILASLALDKSKLGSYLRTLNGRGDLRVSVYVDDIIISANTDTVLHEVEGELKVVANAALFPLSTSKTEGPAGAVTAFNIELSHGAVRITEARIAQLRAAYEETTSEYCRAGILSYVGSINRTQLEAFA